MATSPLSLPIPATAGELIHRYEGFLLDAYGVLVHGGGPFPGAADFLHALERAGRPWLIVSNDASKTPEHAASRYRNYGFPVTEAHVLNAAMLLGDWFARNDLLGAGCRVLGTADSAAMVQRAGGVVLDLKDPDFDVLVLCDEAGYPLLETLDDTLTCLVHACERGRAVALVLPNPDLTYPRGPGQGAAGTGQWGFAAGALAAMLESGLAARGSLTNARFEPLGKPHRAMFERALTLLGTRNTLMIGDQLPTDIRGGQAAGLDTALASWGVTRWPVEHALDVPTWLLRGF